MLLLSLRLSIQMLSLAHKMNVTAAHLLKYTGTTKITPQRVTSGTLMPHPLKSVSAKCQFKGKEVYPQDKKERKNGFHICRLVAEIFHFSSLLYLN